MATPRLQSAFFIVPSASLRVFELLQTGERRFFLRERAMAVYPVPVGSANRTQSAAIFAAEGFHRHRKNHLFGDHVRQRHSVSGKKADPQFFFRNFDFFLTRDGRNRTISKIKIALNWDCYRRKTAVTMRAEPRPDVPPDADLRTHQFSHRLDFQRAGRLEIRRAVIQRSGSVGPGNYDPVTLQLCQSNKHRAPEHNRSLYQPRPACQEMLKTQALAGHLPTGRSASCEDEYRSGPERPKPQTLCPPRLAVASAEAIPRYTTTPRKREARRFPLPPRPHGQHPSQGGPNEKVCLASGSWFSPDAGGMWRKFARQLK
jgi:hypothetical protein